MTTAASTSTRKPRSDHYADADFKGLGIIICGICRHPLAEHNYIGPCRELPYGEILRVSATEQRRRRPNK